VEGCVRNVRDPSLRPLSRQGVPYKRKVKSGVAERESEGAVVLMTSAQQNAGRGKGPYGG
jgi:hypothetical protein